VSETYQRPAGDYEYTPPPEKPTSAWGGWVTFAGITLILVGVVHLIEGLVALLDPDQYVVGSRGLVLHLDYSAYGWIHLVLGVLLVLVGVGVLNRNPVARVAGVVLVGLSALVTLGFLAANPVWAGVMLSLDVIFIYAIVVHGDDVH